jgi:glucokinase
MCINNQNTIGIDVGGTKIKIGKVSQGKIVQEVLLPTGAHRPQDAIIKDLEQGIKAIIDTDTSGIGICVPGLVDEKNGIVYNPHNIPSWKETHLKEKLEPIFNIPVRVTNDANCFALGEKVYGNGKKYHNMVGLCLGTGVGAGIIINDQLYSGVLSMSGEFGGIPYLQYDYEYYCSGKFFLNCHGITGQEAYNRAVSTDIKAIKMFDEYGFHLGKLVQTILLTVGPEAIILGGTVSQSYRFFHKSLMETINSFPHQPIIDRLEIKISDLGRTAVLGASSLVCT